MINTPESNRPKVSLRRDQWIRLAIVGMLLAFALGRTVPDVVRAFYPLHVFGYVTDDDGVVLNVARPHTAPAHGPAADTIRVGDRVLIAKIKPFDRKPGLAGVGLTYDNPDRRLPIERAGHERILHLIARDETPTSRFLALLRIGLFAIAVALGAMLYLVKPGIATGAFFFFCLGSEAPTTYLDLVTPNPWREILIWAGATLAGSARSALLLFALCMIDGGRNARRERIFAYVTAAVGLAIGTFGAYTDWRFTFGALPSQHLHTIVAAISNALSVLTTLVFAYAFLRTRGAKRRRITWIVTAFVFAAVARLASDTLFPAHIPLWFNTLLLSTTIVPIVVTWIAVVRQRYFNVDFVVSRAVVYVALTAAAIAIVSVSEEVGTYLFYNNTDIAYGFIIGISMLIGATTGKIREFLEHVVDRFIFRDRRAQREALELIAGYILDAECTEDVYRALLNDCTSALQLAFGGIFTRNADGDYVLTSEHAWPSDCVARLQASDELTRLITHSRSALSFSAKDTNMIQRAFPNERLTFAAPLFFDRSVTAIVVYGHNVSGLDLDPDEREHLVRVVAHASIALGAIELSRLRESPAPALS